MWDSLFFVVKNPCITETANLSDATRRGLLLFIDEAEAFLGKRSSPGMSEDTRNALNALLYNTGSASRRLMMVLATNRAEVRCSSLKR